MVTSRQLLMLFAIATTSTNFCIVKFQTTISIQSIPLLCCPVVLSPTTCHRDTPTVQPLHLTLLSVQLRPLSNLNTNNDLASL